MKVYSLGMSIGHVIPAGLRIPRLKGNPLVASRAETAFIMNGGLFRLIESSAGQSFYKAI